MEATGLAKPVEYADVYLALGVAAILIAVFAVVVFVQRRRPLPAAPVPLVTMPGDPEASPDRFAKLETQVTAIAQRQLTDEKRLIDTEHSVNNIRAALAALPSKDAVHRLEVAQTALAGKVELLDSTTTATQRGVARIEDLLLARSERS